MTLSHGRLRWLDRNLPGGRFVALEAFNALTPEQLDAVAGGCELDLSWLEGVPGLACFLALGEGELDEIIAGGEVTEADLAAHVEQDALAAQDAALRAQLHERLKDWRAGKLKPEAPVDPMANKPKWARYFFSGRGVEGRAREMRVDFRELLGGT